AVSIKRFSTPGAVRKGSSGSSARTSQGDAGGFAAAGAGALALDWALVWAWAGPPRTDVSHAAARSRRVAERGVMHGPEMQRGEPEGPPLKSKPSSTGLRTGSSS